MLTRARLGLAVALSLAALPAALATAADPAPAPGCAGNSFIDPAGDSVSNATGAPGADQPAQPNLDITAGFFLDDGATTTANIRVVNLDQKVPSGATGIEWYMLFKQGDADNFVHAAITSGGDPTFTYGSVDPNTGVLTDAGETGGKLFEGKDGVIQIALPGDFATGTLTSPYAQAAESVTIPGVGGAFSTDDNAPDEMNGTDYQVGGCAAAPPASGGDTGGQPAPQQSPPSSSPPAGLTLTVDPRAGSARAVNKRHRVTLALRSNGNVRSIVATLLGKTGKGKALAKGKLAKLNGSGALRLKTGKRTRLKKGRYVLRITAIGPSGQKGTQVFPVALKK